MKTPELAIKKGTILELHHSLQFDNSQIDELGKELAGLPENIRSIEHQLSDLNLFKATQLREYYEVSADIEKLNEELSILEDSINNLESIKADVSALKNRKETIHQTIIALNEKSNTIELKNDANEQKVAKLEQQLQTYTNRMTTDQDLLDYLIDTADKLSIKMDDVMNSLSDVEINEVINDADLAPIFNEWQRKVLETADADYAAPRDVSAESDFESTHDHVKLSSSHETFFHGSKLSHPEHSKKK